MRSIISPMCGGEHSPKFSLFVPSRPDRNKAASYRAQLFRLSIAERAPFRHRRRRFEVRPKPERGEGRFHCRPMAAINIQLTPPSRPIFRGEEHKPAERAAVFIGKRVEKPFLFLICHKGDLRPCDVRTLLRLCINSSHADRLREAPTGLLLIHINGQVIRYRNALQKRQNFVFRFKEK